VFAMNMEINTAVNCFQAQCVGEEKRAGLEADRLPQVLKSYIFQESHRQKVFLFTYIYIYIYI